MKLLPSVLIATAHACGRIPGAKETQAVLDGAKYGRGHTHEWTTNTPRPQVVPESQMIGEDDEWYAINDGVMGGVSTGSASWYALNDGVMGGVSSGASVPNDDYLKYKGQLSLENNGGFSQIRHDVEPDQFVGATSVTLHIRASAPGRDFKFIASAATSARHVGPQACGRPPAPPLRTTRLAPAHAAQAEVRALLAAAGGAWCCAGWAARSRSAAVSRRQR